MINKVIHTKSLEDAKKLYMDIAEFGGEVREKIGGYVVTEAASKMPWMSDDEFRELQISLHEQGQLDDIELNASDEIVDGRNRMLACLAQDIEPTISYSKHEEETEVVEMRNLRRRNLSPNIKAHLYLKLHGIFSEESEAEATEESEQQEETLQQDLETASVTEVSESADETSEAASEPVAKNESPPKAEKESGKSGGKSKGKKSSVKESSSELGISDRTMKRARAVASSAIQAVSDAVIAKKITARAAEKIAELPKEEQQEALDAAIAGGKKREPKDPSKFDAESTATSFIKRISKMIAGVPADARDLVHRKIAESLGVTVRLERETPDMLNSESFVPYVEQLIEDMPKTERAGAEKALAERYSAVVVVKDSEQAMMKINGVVENLSEREKKKVAQALGEQYKLPTSSKPADYLPKLPDSHAEACEVVAKEIKTRVDGLVGFEEWEVNGRRTAGRSLKTTAQNALKKFSKHAKLEAEADPVLIDTKFAEHLDNETFKTAWNEWLAAKKKQKKEVSAPTQVRQLNILAHFDSEQAVEILTKAMQKPWDGIPVFRELAQTPWAGRPPAYPPVDKKTEEETPSSQNPESNNEAPPKRRIPNVPTKSTDIPDRRTNGRIDTSSVPQMSMQEKVRRLDD